MSELNDNTKQSNDMKERTHNMGRPMKYEGGWESVKAAFMKRYAQENLIGKFYCPICNAEMICRRSVNSM